MKTLFLHIGTPKTATTSLQYFCRDNQKIFEKYSFCYPMFPYRFPHINDVRNGHFLIGRLHDSEENRDTNEAANVLQEGMDTVNDLFKRFNNIILSDEGLWTATGDGREAIWSVIKKEAEKGGFAVKVIVYLRRQDSYASSWWNQKVKMGKRKYSTTSWESFIRDPGNAIGLDYYKNLRKISDVLGKENLIVRRFGKQYLKNGSIFEDFFDALGLEYTDEYVIKERERNIRLDGNAIEIKRILNGLPGLDGKDNVLLREIVMKVSETNKQKNKTSYFTEEEARAFLEPYREGNRKVMREYLGQEEDLFDMHFKKREKWVPESSCMEQDLIVLMGNMAMEFRRENESLRKRLELQEKELTRQKQALETFKNKIKHPLKTIMTGVGK